MKTSVVLLLAVVLAVPAGLCAQDSTKPKIKRSPDLITLEEIQAFAPNAQTAYDIVKQLRSLWLQQRGPSSLTLTAHEVQVYVDGVNRGGPSALTEIRGSAVRELQRLRPSDATQRYGVDHENGAILVKLK
jgi:hypothetical protein